MMKSFYLLTALALSFWHPLKVYSNDYIFLKGKDSSSYDGFTHESKTGVGIYGVTSDGTETLLNFYEAKNDWPTIYQGAVKNGIVDEYEGTIIFFAREYNHETDQEERYHLKYDIINNSFTDIGNSISLDNGLQVPKGIKNIIEKKDDGSVQIGGDTNDIDVVEDGLNIDGGAVITKNTDGSVQIGGDTDDIDIVSDGLNIDGAAVITKMLMGLFKLVLMEMILI